MCTELNMPIDTQSIQCIRIWPPSSQSSVALPVCSMIDTIRIYQQDTVPAITTQSQLPASKQCCETNLPLLYPQRIQEAPRLASVQAEAVIGDHEDFYPNVDPNSFNSPHHLRSISIHFHDLPSFSIISIFTANIPHELLAFQANFRPISGQVALAEAASS